MRSPFFAAACLLATTGLVTAEPAHRAACEVTATFDGAPVAGARVVGGPAETFALDLFQPHPTHEMLVTVTGNNAVPSVTIVIRSLTDAFDLFLETRLNDVVLSLSVDGGSAGATFDAISLRCRPG